jgi:hypothetical protein
VLPAHERLVADDLMAVEIDESNAGTVCPEHRIFIVPPSTRRMRAGLPAARSPTSARPGPSDWATS